jgi:hypothetical protein
MLSKTERGNTGQSAKKVAPSAKAFGGKGNEWPTRWLTDEIYEGIKDKGYAAVAKGVAEKHKRLEKRNAPVKVRLPGDAISRDVLEWQK